VVSVGATTGGGHAESSDRRGRPVTITATYRGSFRDPVFRDLEWSSRRSAASARIDHRATVHLASWFGGHQQLTALALGPNTPPTTAA